MRRFVPLLIGAVLLLAQAAGLRAQQDVKVFAAASLRDVLEDARRQYRGESGTEVTLVFAASSVLARQIDAGAPADAYISADVEWMDWLVKQGAVEERSVRIVAGNNLVVALPEGSSDTAHSLEAILGAGRFAMGDPSHVPAGRYAAEALKNLGLWDRIQPNAVYCENVRVALEFVRRGEVRAGIVYGSDLAAAPELVKAFEFPGDSHAPIRYAGAPVSNGDERAVGFLEYLAGMDGSALFAEYGFSPVPPEGQ